MYKSAYNLDELSNKHKSKKHKSKKDKSKKNDNSSDGNSSDGNSSDGNSTDDDITNLGNKITNKIKNSASSDYNYIQNTI